MKTLAPLISAVAASRSYNSDIAPSIAALPYDFLGDDYKRNPEAACRKALRLTASLRNRHNIRLRAIDRLLGTHGVEHVCTRSGAPGFSYANTGDSYACTVVLFESGTFRVTSWGDIVERGGNRYA